MNIKTLERAENIARNAYTAGRGEGCPALRAVADGFERDRLAQRARPAPRHPVCSGWEVW